MSPMPPSELLEGERSVDDTPLLVARVAAGGRGDDEERSIPVHRLPPHPTWKDFAAYPYLSARTFFDGLADVYTWKFVLYLAISQCLVSGALQSLIDLAALPIFKELGANASRLQFYKAVIYSPWSIKPFIGVASDLFPIGGYHKRYWALHGMAVGVVGSALLVRGYHSGAAVLVACFTAISYEAAVMDILGEGKYSERLRERPDSGSDVVTFRFGCFIIGALISSSFVGPMSDAGLFHELFYIALALSATPILPLLRGWVPEVRQEEQPGFKKIFGTCCMFNRRMFDSNRSLFVVIALSGMAGPVLAVVTTFAHRWIGLILSVAIIVALTALSYKVLPRVVSNVVLFETISRLTRPRIRSALDFFYTADDACLPNGPDFSYTFYITATGIVGLIVHLIAVFLYQAYLSTWRYRPVLITTLILGCTGSLVDLVIVLRWNTDIGIPDRAFYMLGSAVLESLVDMLHAIPIATITAKLCPPGMESAVFAFVVGIANFGLMLSSLFGALLIDWSGLDTVGSNCDFDDLWILIVTFQITLPLLAGIPATWLIPNAKQTEPLIDWDTEEMGRDSEANGDKGGDKDGEEERSETIISDEDDSESEALSE